MSIQQQFFFGLLSLCIPVSAIAATHEWSSGYAQGTTEYHIADGQGNTLLISCPMGRDQPIQASLTMSNGLTFTSPTNQAAHGEYEMSLIVDGEIFRDPFNTSCRACEDTFVYEFWPALRKANNLYVQTAHDKTRFSTEGIDRVVLPLDHLDNTCLTANEALMRARAPLRLTSCPLF